jgi:hypothetical protein
MCCHLKTIYHEAMACFSFHSKSDYSVLSKKNDDYVRGLMKVCDAWKARFPLGKDFQDSNFNDEKAYCKALLLSLKDVPYTDDTNALVLDHIKSIASQSYLVHRTLLDTLNSSSVGSLDSKIRSDVGFTLVRIAPQA